MGVVGATCPATCAAYSTAYGRGKGSTGVRAAGELLAAQSRIWGVEGGLETNPVW